MNQSNGVGLVMVFRHRKTRRPPGLAGSARSEQLGTPQEGQNFSEGQGFRCPS